MVFPGNWRKNCSGRSYGVGDMKRLALALAFAGCCAPAFAQNLVVTAEGRHGAAPPEVTKDEVSVQLNRGLARVESWTPLRGDNAALQLYIAIDDGEDTDLSIQFGSLKKLIREQPASTQIGLVYLRYGTARIESPLTTDREQTARALRIPLGDPGITGSPYIALSDLIHKWPAPPSPDVRREVLLISDGIDLYSEPNPENPYLLTAIADAQRAGIPVHSIWYAGAGHIGHSYFHINWGANFLSELGDATGGEAYWQGFSAPVVFDSFLNDFSQRLRNQYLLTVSLDNAKGKLVPIRVVCSNPQVSLVTARMLYLPRNPD